jgi:RNA polymerase sigma-70 factor, ECF subfamily
MTQAVDLYLACACLARVPGAVERFSELYLARTAMYLGKLARSPDRVAEVRQRLGIRALVGDSGRPALEDYSGRGSLEGWVRVAANRIALLIERTEGRRASWEQAAEAPAVEQDRELAHLKETYREPFRQAFRRAAGLLGREHRVLLRLHYVEGATTAQLAAMYGVSRPTMVRRIAAARDALVEQLRQLLGPTLGVPPAELESLFALVRSQLDLDLSSLLKKTMG